METVTTHPAYLAAPWALRAALAANDPAMYDGPMVGVIVKPVDEVVEKLGVEIDGFEGLGAEEAIAAIEAAVDAGIAVVAPFKGLHGETRFQLYPRSVVRKGARSARGWQAWTLEQLGESAARRSAAAKPAKKTAAMRPVKPPPPPVTVVTPVSKEVLAMPENTALITKARQAIATKAKADADLKAAVADLAAAGASLSGIGKAVGLQAVQVARLLGKSYGKE